MSRLESVGAGWSPRLVGAQVGSGTSGAARTALKIRPGDVDVIGRVRGRRGWAGAMAAGPKEPLAMAGFVAGGGMSEHAGILRDEGLGDLEIGRAGSGGVLALVAPSEGGGRKRGIGERVVQEEQFVDEQFVDELFGGKIDGVR